jgi:hypothetical protein
MNPNLLQNSLSFPNPNPCPHRLGSHHPGHQSFSPPMWPGSPLMNNFPYSYRSAPPAPISVLPPASPSNSGMFSGNFIQNMHQHYHFPYDPSRPELAFAGGLCNSCNANVSGDSELCPSCIARLRS